MAVLAAVRCCIGCSQVLPFTVTLDAIENQLVLKLMSSEMCISVQVFSASPILSRAFDLGYAVSTISFSRVILTA